MERQSEGSAHTYMFPMNNKKRIHNFKTVQKRILRSFFCFAKFAKKLFVFDKMTHKEDSSDRIQANNYFSMFLIAKHMDCTMNSLRLISFFCDKESTSCKSSLFILIEINSFSGFCGLNDDIETLLSYYIIPILDI